MAQFDQQARLREVAEKVRLQKIENEKQEQAYFKSLMTGNWWGVFKGVMVFCMLMVVLTTIDTFVDAGTRKLDRSEWEVDRSLYAIGYQSIWVNEALFMPSFDQWIGFEPNSFEVTESFIFRDEKRLHFVQIPYASSVSEERPMLRHIPRIRAIYTWFPYLQILLLIPLLTFIFKRPSAWFKFGRGASLIIIGPATMALLIYCLI